MFSDADSLKPIKIELRKLLSSQPEDDGSKASREASKMLKSNQDLFKLVKELSKKCDGYVKRVRDDYVEYTKKPKIAPSV